MASKPRVRGLAVKLDAKTAGPSEDVLEDTIARMNAGMNTTISTNGVSISASRGVRVDGEAMDGVSRRDIEFEEEGFLGQGASSIVRKARSVARPSVKYAVKMFKIFDEARRHQLMKEVRILFSLDCAALVQFHGAFLEESRVGVILEYMDAGSLDRIRTPLSEPIVAAICYQMLWGLAYLHFERRLHRDIKPGNVLLNSRGEVKLSDFGISRELSDRDQIASTMVGTFRYMSPERLHGLDYSFASDVWSVGIIALDAARGTPLFSAHATPVEIVQLVKDQDFAKKPLRQLSGRFSPHFERFVLACLSIEPSQRPSADAAITDDDWLASHAPDLWPNVPHDEPPSVEHAAEFLKPWILQQQREEEEKKKKKAAAAAAATQQQQQQPQQRRTNRGPAQDNNNGRYSEMKHHHHDDHHHPQRLTTQQQSNNSTGPRQHTTRNSDDAKQRERHDDDDDSGSRAAIGLAQRGPGRSRAATHAPRQPSMGRGDPLNMTYRSDIGDDDDDDDPEDDRFTRTYHDLAQTIQDDDDDDED